jgi:hypothetical protein
VDANCALAFQIPHRHRKNCTLVEHLAANECDPASPYLLPIALLFADTNPEVFHLSYAELCRKAPFCGIPVK